jgi:ABC-type proline/glycine betaine transport system ATPase subunit
LYVTHDRDEATAFGGRIFRIASGAIRDAEEAT